MFVDNLNGRRVVWNVTPGPITFDFGDELKTEIDQSWPPRIRALGVVLTNYCPLACKHCYNDSSPKGEEMLALGDLKNFVEFLLAEGHPLSAVGLSGGEALYHPEFFEIAEYMADMGLYVSCNTGGHGLSDQKLSEMKEGGVHEVVFSSDWYHERFVSQHSLFDLINKSAELFKRATVKIAVENKEEGLARVEKLDSMLDRKVDIVVQPVLKIGRASSRHFAHVRNWSALDDSDASNCSREFEILGINYDGRVYACCSVGSFTKGLEIGNIKDQGDYHNIPVRYRKNAQLKRLHCDGWDSSQLKAQGLHKCEMCNSKMNCNSEIWAENQEALPSATWL